MGLRVGVDVGGTFTDFLVVDEAGNAGVYKTSTTPEDPSIGFFRGLEKAASRSAGCNLMPSCSRWKR